MILLNKGLTKITACVAILIVLVSTSLVTWSLIAIAGGHQPAVDSNIIRIDAVIYNRESKELTLNIRVPKEQIKYSNVTLFKIDGECSKIIHVASIKDFIVSLSDLNLVVISLKLDNELLGGNYYLKLEIKNKLLEYKFSL
ncbi:MAG: hypothetical protein QW596_03995 [Sulfolobales archaeon]